MNIWIIIWLVLWITVIGSPLLLFKKYKITFYEKSWQHTIFYILSLGLLYFVYKNPFYVYFQNLSLGYILIPICLFLLWFFMPFLYQKDFYTKQERARYQIPMFFNILFQQLCFLGGLLTFGISPTAFGLVFFIIHMPMIFFVPKKFALIAISGSLIGGILISYLQSLGFAGFLISFLVHLLFWGSVHYVFSLKNFSGTALTKR